MCIPLVEVSRDLGLVVSDVDHDLPFHLLTTKLATT